MTSSYSDELISAYLDGELTAEQQARVESQLRDNADLRRMCDELRVLRHVLQSMPTADPPQDLTQRVLRQAERSMLLGGEQSSQAITVTRPDGAEAAAPHSSTRAGRRNWRLVAGFIAAAAALFLVATVLFDPLGLAPQAGKLASSTGSRAASNAAVQDNSEVEAEKEALADDKASESDDARVSGWLERPQSVLADGDAPAQAGSLGGRALGESLADAPAPELGKPVDSAASAGERGAPRPIPGGSGGADAYAYGMGSAGSGTTVPGGAKQEMAPREGMSVAGPEGNSRRVSRAAAPSIVPARPGREAGDSDIQWRAFRMKPAPDQSTSTTDLPTAALAVQPSAAQEADVQQLVGQLNAHRSLLAEVRLPRDSKGMFFESDGTPITESSQLGLTARKLLESDGGALGELRLPVLRGVEPSGERLNTTDHRILVVEGTPTEVRESLERLVIRPDIQLRFALFAGKKPSRDATLDAVASDATGQEPTLAEPGTVAEQATAAPEEAAPEEAAPDDAMLKRRSALKDERQQSGLVQEEDKLVRDDKPLQGQDSPKDKAASSGMAAVSVQSTPAPSTQPDRIVYILFRFKELPATPAAEQPGTDK